MTYMTAQQAAEKWGISVRQVQRLLAAERIPDAIRHGRTWLIPAHAEKPADGRKEKSNTEERTVKETKQDFDVLPMLKGEFQPGEAMAYIESLPAEELQQIALAEYAYFRGDAAETVRLTKNFIAHENLFLRLTALILFTFGNLPLGHIHQARFGMEKLQEMMKILEKEEVTAEQRAIGLFVFTMSRVLLHLPMDGVPPMEQHLRYLPGGLRFFSCYVMAHKVYLEGEYGRALGIAETALAIQNGSYVIASVYLHIVAAMKQTEKAKAHFVAAWGLAQPDDLLEGFGEHHGLLHGLIEICLQDTFPTEYRRIIAITYSFSASWRKVHNPETQETVADNLTTTEFTIAMLANRGWTNGEIAAHLHLSEHTVKRYVSEIYQKLGISSRKQLQQFMLR